MLPGRGVDMTRLVRGSNVTIGANRNNSEAGGALHRAVPSGRCREKSVHEELQGALGKESFHNLQ